MMSTVTGTPYYAAPEVWAGKPYDSKSDIWSLGIILYELAALQYPFNGKSILSLHEAIKQGTYFRIPKEYSNDLVKIIGQCLQQKPSKRPKAKKLLKSEEVGKHLKEMFQEEDEIPIQLLDTIRPSGNLDTIQDRLPDPKYTSFQDKSLMKISGVSQLDKATSEQLRRGSMKVKNKNGKLEESDKTLGSDKTNNT